MHGMRELYPIRATTGPDALMPLEVDAEPHKIASAVTATPVPANSLGDAHQPPEMGAMSFGSLAELWERDYVDRVVGGKRLVAASTRQKYRNHLHNHILPRWSNTRIGELRAKNVLDWLQEESGSWYMMTDLRNIMSGIFTKAQEWEVLPDTLANPIARVKLPKKWLIYEKRILTEEETVRVLGRMQDPHLLIGELCLATGARISEITGLQVKHVSIPRGLIRIEQRHWRGDVDCPKTERSKRTLTLGSVAGRLNSWIESLEDNTPQAWVFPQHDRRKPMWDSGVRAALKEAARAESCDFPGLGLHSLRRANITWRQEVGGSSIEASRIAGHASTKMTEEYTVVQLKRQEELTRRIQEKLIQAASRINEPEGTIIAPAQNPFTTGQNCLALDSFQSNECDGSIRQQRRRPMPTFIIDSENHIRKMRREEDVRDRGRAFTSKQDLARLTARWRGSRLVEIWNRVPGVKPINRFTDRKIAIDRIWKAIQPLGTGVANVDRPARIVQGTTTRKRTQKPRRNKTAVLEIGKLREGSKKAVILQLLQRPAGASLQDLMAATGWQAHSVRGFISAGGKRMGLQVESSKRKDGQRVYQIR